MSHSQKALAPCQRGGCVIVKRNGMKKALRWRKDRDGFFGSVENYVERRELRGLVLFFDDDRTPLNCFRSLMRQGQEIGSSVKDHREQSD